MGLKSKLTSLEQRLGVSRCPHCGVTAARRDADPDGSALTDAERAEVVARFLFRVYDREQLLQLLAAADPAKRQSVADVYPLPTGGRSSTGGGGQDAVVEPLE